MDIAQLITKYGDFKVEVISFQGELMELALIEGKLNTEIGAAITCIYNHKIMESRVIRHNETRLYLFIPHTAYQFIDDRRNTIRMDIDLSGLLINNDVHLPVKVIDISYTGISFYSNDDSIKLHDNYHLAISSEFLSIVPQIRILYKMMNEDSIRYGAEILFIPQDSLPQLKHFLMYSQILKRKEEL